MSKKPSPAPRIAPLQRVVAEPILDTAEQAALDEQRKENKKVAYTVGPQDDGQRMTAASAVLELGRRLPAEEMPSFLAQLMFQFSSDGQLQLLNHLVAQLHPEVLLHLEQALHARIGNGTH